MGDLTAPRREVMATLGRHVEEGRPAVLATVVDVDGSAYRRPGARAVVSPDAAEPVGAITASCLVEEVRGLAETVLAEGDPRVERFDLTGDDDEWGLGLGCNGVIDVLLEPVDDSHGPAVRAFRAGEDATVATVVGGTDDRTSVGDRTYLGREAGFEDRRSIPEDVLGRVLDRVEGEDQPGTGVVTVETDRGTVEVFVDRVEAPPRLVVVGTGQDVRPVVDLAGSADFRVTVAGFRGAAATDDRFPGADRVVATSPARITEDLAVDRDTYVVLMTHNFVDDRIALAELLETDVEYVGLMGPTERFEEMRGDLAEEGRRLSADERARVYTPVGLDLGAETPYQVAHSIVAEALAVHNGRAGGHLREVGGPIHERPATEPTAGPGDR